MSYFKELSWHLEGLRKTTKVLIQISQSLDQDLRWAHPNKKHEF